MRRMIGVQMRFWFAMLVLGLAMLGNWYWPTLTPPRHGPRTTGVAALPQMSAIGDAVEISDPESQVSPGEPNPEIVDTADSQPGTR
jgi:hypothetical protein